MGQGEFHTLSLRPYCSIQANGHIRLAEISLVSFGDLCRMNGPKNPIKQRSALWRYLSQRVFSAKPKLVVNPFRFFLLYRIQLLEKCLQKDYRIEQQRQQLQRVWNQNQVSQTPPSSNLGDRTQK